MMHALNPLQCPSGQRRCQDDPETLHKSSQNVQDSLPGATLGSHKAHEIIFQYGLLVYLHLLMPQ